MLNRKEKLGVGLVVLLLIVFSGVLFTYGSRKIEEAGEKTGLTLAWQSLSDNRQKDSLAVLVRNHTGRRLSGRLEWHFLSGQGKELGTVAKEIDLASGAEKIVDLPDGQLAENLTKEKILLVKVFLKTNKKKIYLGKWLKK